MPPMTIGSMVAVLLLVPLLIVDRVVPDVSSAAIARAIRCSNSACEGVSTAVAAGACGSGEVVAALAGVINDRAATIAATGRTIRLPPDMRMPT
ncbi:hypothetical protein [Streptomyces fulvoviolaceus]|uniref:hypothetical protein n=1 Tax=Streptomyces fulvoviolaceus TaxID=285535 RepID=UPI001F192616|nr:hypothetical protein [Streptomyces fulvoviolaceus]MCT9080799.1 hypothetical protein [Streptomyces fulvoviolaceus]